MCVLRLSGPYQELTASVRDAFVEFQEAGASKKSREHGHTSKCNDTTYNFTISEADGARVPVQIDEVIAFLSEHRDEIINLRSRPGVESAMLDFMWSIPEDSSGQWNRFPVALLELCVELGLEIEVSVYLGSS